MIDTAINRIRRYKSSKKLSGAALARLAGLHDNSLRDIDSPEWNPRAETLRKLEQAIERDATTESAAE